MRRFKEVAESAALALLSCASFKFGIRSRFLCLSLDGTRRFSVVLWCFAQVVILLASFISFALFTLICLSGASFTFSLSWLGVQS